MSLRHERVEANGIELHYVRSGSGFPLLFLHGWPEYWRTWHRNLSALADSFEVVAPDLRGFGNSEKPDTSALEAYTLADHVVDIEGLVEALGFEQVGIISHDIGARIAQAYTREHPGRVRGLAFFDCPYPGIGKRWIDSDHVSEIWYQTFNRQPWASDLVGSSREACELYIGHFLSHWAADPNAFDTDLEAWIETFTQPGNLQGGFNWYITIEARRKRRIRKEGTDVTKITTPTRFLWGEEDPVLPPEWGDRLGEYFTDYRFDVVPEAGHFPHYERPDMINGEIAEFFNQLI